LFSDSTRRTRPGYFETSFPHPHHFCSLKKTMPITPSTPAQALPPNVSFDWVTQATPIALEAGALLREFYARGVATEYKTDVDLVTVADRTSEKLLLDRLTAAFPDHGIYGEEGTRSRLEQPYRWYVDPLDGTTNFAHGFPVFCVSLGLEHRPPGTPEGTDGELVAGIIYDPMRDELFVAEKGKGAYRNGQPMHVSPTPHLGEALLATGFPSRSRHQNPNAHFYHELTMRTHGLRRAGSAALDLAYVACGRMDGYWEFNLNPWDTTAGALLVLEAGGTITRFDGSKFLLDSKEILVTNSLLEKELLAVFEDMFAGLNLAPLLTPAEFAARRKLLAQSQSS
jgi:myo-inositol-1(or 4)-monophosphatase